AGGVLISAAMRLASVGVMLLTVVAAWLVPDWTRLWLLFAPPPPLVKLPMLPLPLVTVPLALCACEPALLSADDPFDFDVVLRVDRRTRGDLGGDVVVERTDIDRTGDADKAAGDADDEGLHIGVVAGVDVDALARAREPLVQGVDLRVGADHGLGRRADQGHPDRAGDADKAARPGRHDVEDVLARLGLHDDAVRRG